MSSSAIAAFGAALLALGISIRYPWFLLAAVETLLFSVSQDVYHNDWSIRGPLGAVDMLDVLCFGMLIACTRKTWMVSSRASQQSGDGAVAARLFRRRLWGCAVASVVTAVLVIMALAIGNSPTALLSEARTPFLAIAVIWYGLLYVENPARLRQLVWIALASGLVGILVVNRQGYLDAVAKGGRASAEVWLHTTFPCVILCGWSLVYALRPRFTLRRFAVWAAVMSPYFLALALSQTRGYMVGCATGLAVVVSFVSARLRLGLVPVAACLVAVALLGRAAGNEASSARQPEVAAAVGRAGDRMEWDDSADARRQEIEALLEQTEGAQWILGRGLGGGFDARRIHPALRELARNLPYTHAGVFIPFLKLGLVGMLACYVGAGALMVRLVRTFRRTDSALALGSLAGLSAFLATNMGDPLMAPLDGFMLGFAILGGMFATSLDPRWSAASTADPAPRSRGPWQGETRRFPAPRPTSHPGVLGGAATQSKG